MHSIFTVRVFLGFAVCGAVSAEGFHCFKSDKNDILSFSRYPNGQNMGCVATKQKNCLVLRCYGVRNYHFRLNHNGWICRRDCRLVNSTQMTPPVFFSIQRQFTASPAPFKPYRGCFVTGSTKVLYALMCNFAAIDASAQILSISCIFPEFLLVVFALMAFSAFRARSCQIRVLLRAGIESIFVDKIGNRLKLSKIVHRDGSCLFTMSECSLPIFLGILFYFYVLCQLFSLRRVLEIHDV